MAVRNPPPQRQIFEKRVDTSEGHYTRYEISLVNLDLLRTWPVTKVYRTFCGVAPTTWNFTISFPEVREDGTASLSVRLVRADSLAVQMDASVWVDVSDLREDEVFPRQSFTRHQMVTGETLAETIPLDPYPGMAPAINENLLALVTIIVTNCHPFE